MHHGRPRSASCIDHRTHGWCAALAVGVGLPVSAAVSREPGEVGLLATVWDALTKWRPVEDELPSVLEFMPWELFEPTDDSDEATDTGLPTKEPPGHPAHLGRTGGCVLSGGVDSVTTRGVLVESAGG